jgi:hypothetical protein
MRTLTIGLIASAAIVASASGAQAATLVGQSPPTAGTPAFCGPNGEFAQLSTTSGNGYTVPGPGVITEWQTFGDPGDTGVTAGFRVYTKQPTTVTPVFDSGHKPLVPGLNKFPIRVPVAGNELIGMLSPPAAPAVCRYETGLAGDVFHAETPPESLNTPEPILDNPMNLLDIAAVVEPDADNDDFGDETQDLCPTDATKQGDCTAPDAQLDKRPKKRSKSRTATFKFSSDDPAATFRCAIDKKSLKSCSSPKKFRKLKERKHKFKLVATDAAGNASEQTTFRWRVVD